MSGTKTLYVFVSNGGDGSYYPRYTFNKEWVDEMGEKYSNGELDHESTPGCDGDGFHYDELQVPVECTLESLGCGSDLAERD